MVAPLLVAGLGAGALKGGWDIFGGIRGYRRGKRKALREKARLAELARRAGIRQQEMNYGAGMQGPTASRREFLTNEPYSQGMADIKSNINEARKNMVWNSISQGLGIGANLMTGLGALNPNTPTPTPEGAVYPLSDNSEPIGLPDMTEYFPKEINARRKFLLNSIDYR